jgi:hypothetical protein
VRGGLVVVAALCTIPAQRHYVGSRRGHRPATATLGNPGQPLGASHLPLGHGPASPLRGF